MDYDENDFQSQNSQLVGEDKFSTNLRSFDLPRFDIDDHLRFDSLVEEEVLLGMQGQENNWIDFPPGSSAIEFSSSAAESCSIARHNNVWSEATSSESVDLLLKSVGEDEMINTKVIMETSANDESHGIDNQVDLYVEKDDAHESSMMDILPVDPKLAQDKLQENFLGSNEGQREMLPNAEGSCQAAEGEESRISMYVHSSNRKFSSDRKLAGSLYTIGDNVNSFYDDIEKTKVDDKGLCEEVLNEKDVCEVIMRTEAPSIDDSDSCGVDNQSLESNQDVKLYMEAEKLKTGLFSVGQDQQNISNTSDFLCDDAHTEKSLVMYNDDKKNHQLVSKSDSSEPLNTKCIDSVFAENSDGLAGGIPCQSKSLNGNSETCEKFFTEDECMSRLAMEQEGKIDASSKAILKRMTQLAEGYSSVGDRLPYDSVEDDVQCIRTQLIKSSALSCDDRGGKLETCIDAIDIKQDPEGQMVESRSTDVENATPLLTESSDSIHVNYGTQVTDIEDCKRMSTNPLSFTRHKLGLVVEGNSDKYMDVDRQEVKLDEAKDVAPDESSLPISVTDESSLPITVTDTESRNSPSTYCKSSVCKAAISVTDLTEVHMAQVHVSVDMNSSLTYMGTGRINSGPVSKVMKKVQDLPPTVRDTAEELSLDGSANKLVGEELDSVPLSLGFEKSSSLHLSNPEHATNVDLAVGKKESLIQVLPANIIHSDGKDVKISGVIVSPLPTTNLIVEKESKLVSVSYPLNMKDACPEKVPQGDSDAQLASPVKSPDSQLSKGTVGLNLTMEQKDGPSSCLAIPDSCDSKENEMKLSGSSMLSNSRKNVGKDTANGAVAGSDCVEYALVNSSTEHIPIAIVQPPSPVRSTGYTLPQIDIPSSVGNAVGSGKTLLLEGNDVSHASSQEGKDDILNSLEVVSHARNEASLALAQTASGRQEVHMPPSLDKEYSCKSPNNEQKDQYKLAERDVSDGQNVSAQTEDNLLNRHMNDSSQICPGSTAESNSSEAQSGNSSSSERNFVSPIVINCRGSHRDDSEHQELKVSGSMALVSFEKDEITYKVDCSSDNLHVTSVDDRSFTFEVSTSEDLPERGSGSELSFHNLKANDIPQTPNENSLALPEEVKVLDSSTRTHNQGKSKNASRPSNEKTTASKGKPKREPHALKQSSLMDAKYSSSTRKPVGILSKDMPLVEKLERSSNECSTIKTSSSLAVQTSSIPDLNSSSSSALFHQPFTNLQQVQLRAQIFVYGALISGMPPDEAYMASAFGGTDGGRNLWEGVWHTSIVRFQNQKSPVGSYDTPNSRPAIWIPEQVSMVSDVPSKVSSTSAKSDSITISSAVLNSTVPLPSPLWSLSYGNDGHHTSLSRGSCLSFSHTLSPLAHQTSVSRQHAGVNSPWLAQSPRPGPWFVSSQISALDGITRYSTVPVTETVHVTPIRDSCGPHTPTIQVVSPSALMSAPDNAATTTAADLQMETSKREATSGNNRYTSITQKSRKRKKGAAAEEPTLPASQTLAESVSALSVVENLPLPSASILLSSNSQLNVASHAPVSISTPHTIYPTHYQIIGANNNQQKAILSEESCSKIEQAKVQAENATALAAATVKHSQDIWSQLAAQKNSGLSSQIEEKLVSAAVAAAAAASVAKAAAAAANVASDAAFQAKLLADEAMNAEKTGNTTFNPESGILDVGKKLAGISPVSILKGMDKIHGSGAIISAASEATRRNVESASAAMKQTENLNSIVKAAELAAEAVAQAGTIIAMGDPLPFTLSDLVDAGPEGFWRGHDGASTKLSKESSMHGEEHLGLGSAKEHGGSAKQLNNQFSKDKETQKAADEGNFSSTVHEKDHPVIFSSIQKGSVVEVMSDEDGLKGAWFSARVLDMDDNKAYVCYNDVSTTEGQLKEWIALEKGERAPRIRTAHSTTLVKYEGTRKRRREQLGSYTWEVGDHVDAWIHDRWWEGTITEKGLGDETKLTVHIPARDDTQVVHTWNLRLSLIWKDGQWSEWSHAKSFKPLEGDTPQEKRQRLGRLEAKIHSEVDAAGMGKLSKNILIEASRKPDDSRSLVLSAKDRTFSIGKNSREEVISDAIKPKQTGLQKEGPRVVFGVPRPGKKRKFMEVSKHYVANKSEKINEGNDSIKFAKYLMPQTSRQSRNTSKVDNKGKKAVEIKPRGSFKAENSKSFRNRSLAEKDKASLTTSNEETVHAYHRDAISSFKAVESEYSVQPAPAPLSKKGNTPGSEMDLTVKPKSSMDGTSTDEDKGPVNPGKAMHEIMEPRRSNRRIQPTSRLLEGLQSSLVISKISSVSNERRLPRGGSLSRGNLRG